MTKARSAQLPSATIIIIWLAIFHQHTVSSTLLLDGEWLSWKSRHGMSYRDEREESQRRMVWEQNYESITSHNNGNYTFQLGLNRFADLTNEEFEQMYLKPLRADPEDEVAMEDHVLSGVTSYPTSLDWREKGFVTQVKDQGYCGSSWAFSAIGAVEGQYFKQKGRSESLSVQQLVDCSWSYGNAGCNGGHMVSSFKYIQNNGGICGQSSYPYLGYIWHCMSKFCSPAASVSGFRRAASGSEANLLDALYNIGPISIALDGSGNNFQFYTGGVYRNSQCTSKKLNLALVLVGYGTTYDGQGYWIVKNSWGTTWGESGYLKLARNENNMCGVATAASYPTSQ